MEPNPQLHGVVIISLPPSDDPSKGKTVTAFTLSDGDSAFTPPPTAPTPSAFSQPLSPPRPSLFSPKKVILYLLAAVFVAVSIYGCLYSELSYQLLSGSVREEMRKNETKSFLLQLYPKQRGRVLRETGDVKLSQDGIEEKMAATVRSDPSGSENSSTVLPIQGNVYPDG
jgi:hypothetical protein